MMYTLPKFNSEMEAARIKTHKKYRYVNESNEQRKGPRGAYIKKLLFVLPLHRLAVMPGQIV